MRTSVKQNGTQGVRHSVRADRTIVFLVMQYLEGATLTQALTNGALPLDQALKTAIAIADALDTPHRAGIVHRDLSKYKARQCHAHQERREAAGLIGLAKPPGPSRPGRPFRRCRP